MQTNNMVIFNEICIMFIAHFLQCFLDDTLSQSFKDQMAFVIIFISGLNIIVNASTVIYFSSIDLYDSLSDAKAQRLFESKYE